ncbi:MAG: hypothetical protein K2P89_08030, partial [Lachnospiraceae bacterium]|nr:hypothetical protein [Lachnospiraceae bacterium]
MTGITKRKLLVLLCAGMMVTGCACAAQRNAGQEEPEVYSLDLDGNAQEEGTGGEQQGAADGTPQPEESPAHQEPQAEGSSTDSGAGTQNSAGVQDNESGADSKNVQGSEDTRDLYTRFLNNEVPAIVGNEFPQNEYAVYKLERGSSYTFAELGKFVDQSHFDPEYMEKTTYDQAQYTYTGCLDSDSRNLLVKFVGLNIYAPDDDSFAVYVISEDKGQLYLTAWYECWARSYTEQYRNGLCSAGGSSGAGDHYSGLSAILSNGIETHIYEAEILSGWWTSYVDEALYHEVFGENGDVPLYVSVYTIGEDKYHTYEFS